MRTCALILDNIRSVENAGSIFRTADCLGVSKIYLIGTTPAPLDRFGRKRSDFAKVSLGAEETVEWEYARDMKAVLEELVSQGFSLLALEQAPGSRPLTGFKAPECFALIVGNEVEGVSNEALERVDAIFEIPMKGSKESLNVSVSAGIALFSLLND